MIFPVTEIQVRRAKPDDAEALVRLRGLMLAAMDNDLGGPDAPWREAARQWFVEQLASPETFAAYVVDDPAAGLVACAAGNVYVHPPGPNDLTTLRARRVDVDVARGARDQSGRRIVDDIRREGLR